MTRQGSGEYGSYATTRNTTVARRLSTTQTQRAARPSTPDNAPREGPACCEFDPALAQARAAEESRSISRGDSDDTRSTRRIEMTSTVDERGAEASRKFQAPLTMSLVSSLSMFGSNIAAISLHATRWSLEASFAVVLWVISACVLMSERETAPMPGGSRNDAV